MNVSGEHRITATREQVWQALHDVDILRACLPGCEDVQAIEPHHFAGRMMARIGAVSTVFTGRLVISDESYPQGWQVAGHAESPSAGWADGTVTVGLAAVSGGTVVSYRLHVDPGGRLAAVGDRLLRGVAMRMANDFFVRLAEHLTPAAALPDDRADSGGPPPPRVNILTPLPRMETPPPAQDQAHSAAPSRAQRIIILVGWIFCAFILLSMGLAVWSRL